MGERGGGGVENVDVFVFKQKEADEIVPGVVCSEMCI